MGNYPSSVFPDVFLASGRMLKTALTMEYPPWREGLSDESARRKALTSGRSIIMVIIYTAFPLLPVSGGQPLTAFSVLTYPKELKRPSGKTESNYHE